MVKTTSPGWNPAASAALAGLDRVDAGRRARLAKDHEECGENGYGQYEICQRPRHNNGRSPPDRLVHEAVPTLVLTHGGNRSLVGYAGRVVVAEEFYITAKWNSRQFPSGAVTVVEAEQLGPKADGENQHSDAAPARDQEVAEFMKEHDDGQDEQKRDEVTQHAAAQRVDPGKKIETHESLSSADPRDRPRLLS